jgi:hypothetical protein
MKYLILGKEHPDWYFMEILKDWCRNGFRIDLSYEKGKIYIK